MRAGSPRGPLIRLRASGIIIIALHSGFFFIIYHCLNVKIFKFQKTRRGIVCVVFFFFFLNIPCTCENGQSSSTFSRGDNKMSRHIHFMRNFFLIYVFIFEFNFDYSRFFILLLLLIRHRLPRYEIFFPRTFCIMHYNRRGWESSGRIAMLHTVRE